MVGAFLNEAQQQICRADLKNCHLLKLFEKITGLKPETLIWINAV
jgi:hypothetical protein